MERDSHPRRLRLARSLSIAALAVAAFAAPIAVASPAAAHSDLIATSPESDTKDQPSVVDVLPEEVSLTFSDDLTPPLPEEQQAGGESTTQIRVFDETCEDAGLLVADPGHADTRECTNYATGEATVDGPTVSTAVDAAGAPAGQYTVVWQVVYQDGHAASQMFTFTTESAAPAATPTADPSAEPSAEPTAEPSSAAEPSDVPAAEDDGISTPVILSIVGGIVVLAIVIFIVMMIARSRRS
ncbi:MAG: copper resistance protein CopC [Microbacterium gubbeenense]